MSYIPPQKIKQEVKKCFEDPNYFINNYCKISHPEKGRIPFTMFAFQEDLVRSFETDRFNIVLKARQLGISTVTAAYALWFILFRRDKTVLCVATKVSTASNLVKKVQMMYKNIPEWLQIVKPTTNNRAVLEFENGSWIKAESTQSTSGRSEALSLLIVDEAAHVEGIDELWTSMYPTLSTGGSCAILSTPNGVGNFFHKMCTEAEAGDNGFKLTKIMWDEHPDRDDEWFENETKNMDRRQVAQELLCNFNASGETVVDPEDMEFIHQFLEDYNEITGELYGDPLRRTGYDRNYWIWQEYNPNCTYLITADVARGDGRDYSTFHVLNATTNHVVAEYRGQPEYDFFAKMLNDAGKEWGTAMIVVESNMLGYSVLTELENMEYPNIYYEKKSTHEYVEPNLAQVTNGVAKGFATSGKTKPQIIGKMEEFIRNKTITIYSRRLLDEMRTFIWTSGKTQAMSGRNDDLIMSFALACWIRDTVLEADTREQEYTIATLNAISRRSRTADFSTVKSGFVMGPFLGRNKKNDIADQARLYRKYAGLLKG